MVFEANGKRYRISFGSEVFQREGKLMSTVRGTLPVRAISRCFLVELPPLDFKAQPMGEPIKLAEGVVHCYVPDLYNKQEGRVRALKSALRIAWPDDHAIWGKAFTAYSNRKAKRKDAV